MTSAAGMAPPVSDRLPKKVVFAVSAGHGGMSILINLLSILLVFFYLPPDNSGLPQLVTDAKFLVVLNAIVIIAAAGRLLDAITDPAIALYSDRSTHKKGRRIPLMRLGALPAGLAVFLMFFPPVREVSTYNIVWLLGIQVVLFIALTAYVTPAFAIVADLGRTPEERLDLTTWTSVAWAIGIVIASLTPFITALFENSGVSTISSYQAAVGIVVSISVVMMYLPVFMIDEPRYARSKPTTATLRESLNVVLENAFFRYYVAADFAYFCGLAMIQTGILYYITVLVELEEELTAPLLGIMVIMALFLYPIVNRQAKKRSAKQMVIFAFVMTSVMFFGIFFLGRYPFPAIAQAIAVVVIFAVPFSILSVIPGWILSDIAEHSIMTRGEATTGMFFGARTFAQKIGQTVGVVIFALLLNFGRDVGDDLGVRLSGFGGMALYAVAAIIFTRYDEDKLRGEMAATGH